MTAWLPRWFALLALPLLFVPLFAAEPDDKEIARLVKQLGDDDFDKREAASKRLMEIGEPTLDVLHQAKKNSDPEVRRRADETFAAIENKLYPELRLTGHADRLFTISLSADGKRLLTCSGDKTLRLWDADTGKELQVFKGHTEWVIGAALSEDGKRVLSGSADKTVRLWDADTGKEVLQMTGHADRVFSVAFGPKDQALSGSHDGAMYLWDLKTGKNVKVFTSHSSTVRQVAYSDKAKVAATCSFDKSIRLWNLDTGKEVRQLKGHTECVIDICFSPDGKRLLSSAGDATLRIWDVDTGKELQRIEHAYAYCAAWSPDGKRLVSGGYYPNAVRVWDAVTGKQLREYEAHSNALNSVLFFPDGKRIASASDDGTARIWRAPR